MHRLNKRLIKSILMTVMGNILYALVAKLFLLPSGLPTGGTTGIALVVQHFTGMSISAFVLVFNVAMLLIGLLILGRQFAATTVLSSFLYPILLELFDRLLGDVRLTEDPMLYTIFAGVGIGVALGVVIRAGASTGGMDIPPLVLNKLLGIPVSISLYAFDFAILLTQALFNPAQDMLYGVVLIMLYTIVLDKVMILGSSRTEVRVVSQQSEAIREAILHQMDRGVTMLKAEGGYSHRPVEMVMSVVSNRELNRLEKIVHDVDPESFMVITRVSEVKGRGFTMNKRYLDQ